MTTNKNEAFGSLLSAAVSYIAACEHKTTAMVEEELGAALGVAGKTVQRYKSGVLPPVTYEQDRIRILAETIVKRRVGSLGREWLERFLHAARYPAADKLLHELCPIPAPSHAKPDRVYENLPAPTYSHFVMRQQAFAEVVDGMERRSAVVLIASLGGMGKTSLAREIAASSLKEDRDVPPFDAVVWVSDRERPGTTTFSLVLDIIAQTLDYPGIVQYTHSEKQYEVEQLLRRQRVLLVVDNFETITDGVLLEWLLRLPEPSKAIITTRQYRREFRNSAILVNLQGMTEAETWELVAERLRVLRMERLVSDLTQLEPLLTVTGGNPKAITLTMGLLKYERRPLQQIVDDLYAARGDLFDDLFSRAWALLDDAARRLLMIATFFVDSASSEALSVTANVTGFDFDRAMERLTDLSLLDEQRADLASEPRYTLHPLVRAFAQARLAEQPDFEQTARERWVEWYGQFASQFGLCWQDIDRLKSIDLEQETVHTAASWAMEQQVYESALTIAKGIAYYDYIRGFWTKKLKVEAIRANSARGLENTTEEAAAWANYIRVLFRQKRLSEAELHLPRLIELSTITALPDDILAEAKNTLAWYWMAQGNLWKSLEIWEESLSDAESLSPSVRISNLKWMAVCLYQLGQTQSAERKLLSALQDAELHRYTGGIISLLIKLAIIDLDREDLTSAQQKLEVCVTMSQNHKTQEFVAEVRRVQGRYYRLSGNYESSWSCLIEAEDLAQRLGMYQELTEAREEMSRLKAQMAAAAE